MSFLVIALSFDMGCIRHDTAGGSKSMLCYGMACYKDLFMSLCNTCDVRNPPPSHVLVLKLNTAW